MEDDPPNYFDAIVERQRLARQATGVCDSCYKPATQFGERWQCCDECKEVFDELYNDFITGNY